MGTTKETTDFNYEEEMGKMSTMGDNITAICMYSSKSGGNICGKGLFEQIEDANRTKKHFTINDSEALKRKLEDFGKDLGWNNGK